MTPRSSSATPDRTVTRREVVRQMGLVPHGWTFFTLEVPALTAGEHTLVSRATDAAGLTQPTNLDMKRTRWENNELFERTIGVA